MSREDTLLFRAPPDSALETALYRQVCQDVTRLLIRHLPPEDVEDECHEVYVRLAEALRNQRVRNQERLRSYAFTVTRRRLFQRIANKIRERDRVDLSDSILPDRLRPEQPDAIVCRQSEVHLLQDLMQSLGKTERQILTLFYLEGHSPEEVCERLDLKPDQFRILKWRAKERCLLLYQRRLRDWQRAILKSRRPALVESPGCAESARSSKRPHPGCRSDV
jgi:RNA polymerase sigma factor (sigma-70 family)